MIKLVGITYSPAQEAWLEGQLPLLKASHLLFDAIRFEVDGAQERCRRGCRERRQANAVSTFARQLETRGTFGNNQSLKGCQPLAHDEQLFFVEIIHLIDQQDQPLVPLGFPQLLFKV